MAVGWFIAPYRIKDGFGTKVRYCALDDYTALVNADGGGWDEAECLGPDAGWAVVKVNASAGTLATIAADVDILRIPVAQLDTSLSSLTAGQKTAITNRLQTLGYTLPELQARFPNPLGTYTLRDVLVFTLSRRRAARFDTNQQTIICDGAVMSCTPVDQLDQEVQ